MRAAFLEVLKTFPRRSGLLPLAAGLHSADSLRTPSLMGHSRFRQRCWLPPSRQELRVWWGVGWDLL